MESDLKPNIIRGWCQLAMECINVRSLCSAERCHRLEIYGNLNVFLPHKHSSNIFSNKPCSDKIQQITQTNTFTRNPIKRILNWYRFRCTRSSELAERFRSCPKAPRDQSRRIVRRTSHAGRAQLNYARGRTYASVWLALFLPRLNSHTWAMFCCSVDELYNESNT